MIIDQNARRKLETMQSTRTLNQGLNEVVAAIKETSVATPKPQVKTPANDLADELRNLQKVIGTGNLNESLSKVAKSLDTFDVNEGAVSQLKTLVGDLSLKLKALADLEVRLPKEIKVDLPHELPVSGKVDVGTIDKLPDVRISNLNEVATQMGILINNLQTATLKAIERSKTEFPRSMNVGNEVKIVDFGDLIDGIEELKKGFNLLLNKEAGTVAFPSGSIPVEIQNWRVPQPVTNININALQGYVHTTANTVAQTAVKLPNYGQLFNRRSVQIYNNSANTIYIGGSDVTTTNGIPVPANSFGNIIDAGYNMIVYGISATGTNDIRVLEVSKDQTGNVQE